YGATDPELAVGEVRPIVGSKVLVVRFELLRPARLLDVAALRSVYVEGSIFDPKYLQSLERAQFLGRLSDRFALPVMPNDEPLDYLAT
ncbi:MAG: RES domain-containing protein, partial [Terriglobia bacterium]